MHLLEAIEKVDEHGVGNVLETLED
jgi:hypothetical protein